VLLVARVLMLVACGPLLFSLPICHCKSGEGTVASTHADSTLIESKDQHDHHHHCSHYPRDHRQLPPEPGKHQPDCPAAYQTPELVRGGETQHQITAPLALSMVVGWIASSTHRDFVRPAAPLRRPLPVPLHIAHCTFVI